MVKMNLESIVYAQINGAFLHILPDELIILYVSLIDSILSIKWKFIDCQLCTNHQHRYLTDQQDNAHAF